MRYKGSLLCDFWLEVLKCFWSTHCTSAQLTHKTTSLKELYCLIGTSLSKKNHKFILIGEWWRGYIGRQEVERHTLDL